jgi:Arc/MetJ family transcription regulator
MRVSVDIEDEKLKEMMRFTGKEDAVEVLEAALSDWLRIKQQLEAFDSIRGIGWEGDLDEMRTNWSDHAAE